MELTTEEFKLFRDLIYQHCGLVIPDSKEYLIKQRLEPIARSENCSSFGDFYLKLKSSTLNGCIKQIIEAITTHETSFFRDSHPYETLTDSVLPKVIKNFNDRKSRLIGLFDTKIRIWSAAASTGQEAYSIAMIIKEFLDNNRTSGLSEQNFEILATDISQKTLAAAMTGQYSQLEMGRGISDMRKMRFFNHVNGCWEVKDSLREMIEFRQFNLIEDIKALGSFDVVFCRNVLIYFDDNTKRKILENIYNMLIDKGILFLGAMENTYCLSDKYSLEKAGSTLFYTKK